jgi:phospholipid/cholesterol/gamma-HCH transport system substrate-binding protein
MREKLVGALWRLAIFVIVCGLGIFALFMVFAQLRFG